MLFILFDSGKSSLMNFILTLAHELLWVDLGGGMDGEIAGLSPRHIKEYKAG
jgi:hypothetical protein